MFGRSEKKNELNEIFGVTPKTTRQRRALLFPLDCTAVAKSLLFIGTIFLTLISSAIGKEIPAFPGAEGFGANTPGGRECEKSRCPLNR
jgi:hypothetical protein